MINKQHAHLMRDIRKYADILTNAKLDSLKFFIKSTYIDEKRENHKS